MKLQAIKVSYDPSNKAFNIWHPLIHYYNVSADVPRWIEPWYAAFTTLGAAQNFFAPWLEGEWKLEDGQHWVGQLRNDFPGGGYQVTLCQTLLMEK